jgi:hypothetical protein
MWEFVGLGCWVWMGDVRFFGLVGGGGVQAIEEGEEVV